MGENGTGRNHQWPRKSQLTTRPTLGLSVLQTEASERVEPEIRPTRKVLKQRTKELATALAILRATLEATTDGILVTDENGKVTDFNDKFLAMWKIPRESLKGSRPVNFQELLSRNFADSERFFFSYY